MASIRQRLERAVAGTRLPPWPPTATAASRRATIFLACRFGKALRLLHNIATFDGVLPRRWATSMLCSTSRLMSVQMVFRLAVCCLWGCLLFCISVSACSLPIIVPVYFVFTCRSACPCWQWHGPRSMLGPCRVLLSMLLCCSVLQELALVQLMQKQLLPYLRAGAASVPVAVDRASRILTDTARLKGLTQGELS